MANEIQAGVTLAVSKGGASITVAESQNATMTNAMMLANVQPIGTSAEAIILGEISANIGYVSIKNLDSTNYVEIGLDAAVTAQVFAKLKAGDVALFPAKTATMYAKANTAAVNILVKACEI